MNVRLGRVPLVQRPSLGFGPVSITSDTFNAVLNSSAAAVDFWSPKCAPCLQFKPIFEEVAADQNNNVFMATLNADENKDILDRYSVDEIPTTIFFSNGLEIDRTKGKMTKEDLVAKLNSLFSAPSSGTTPGSQNGPIAAQPAPGAPGAPSVPSTTILGLLGAGAATVLAIFLISR